MGLQVQLRQAEAGETQLGPFRREHLSFAMTAPVGVIPPAPENSRSLPATIASLASTRPGKEMLGQASMPQPRKLGSSVPQQFAISEPQAPRLRRPRPPRLEPRPRSPRAGSKAVEAASTNPSLVTAKQCCSCGTHSQEVAAVSSPVNLRPVGISRSTPRLHSHRR